MTLKEVSRQAVGTISDNWRKCMRKNTSIFIMTVLLSLPFSGCSSANEAASLASIATEESAFAESTVTEETLGQKGEPFEGQSMESVQSSGYNANTRVLLNSGYEMPLVGLGTWTLDDETAAECVYHALEDGYRLIDTAKYYGNEEGVGDGVRRAIEAGIVTREEVFVTSKIVPYGFEDYREAIKESNDSLGLGYIDLLLIHQQGSDEKELYAAMEQAVQDGLVHSIGLSNYYTPEDFERITSEAKIKPAVLQNENHPYYQNTEMREYISRYGTMMESWYPFGGRGHTQELFNDETIIRIARAHGKTSAQVLVRWHMQAGYIVIPGSSNPDHIAENFSIFDFELSDEEMQAIADMNTGERYENW